MESQGNTTNRQHMLTDERRQVILEKLQSSKAVKTSDLSQTFYVSSMTIRNDLNALAEQGQIIRVHGGAIARKWLTAEPSYNDKASVNQKEKEAIGKYAAGLVEEGMAVFIGNGTTTMATIRHLPHDKSFRVFTNALNHALEVSKFQRANVFVVGGYLRGVSLAMVGRLAHQALKGIYFDLAFLGVNGISIDRGLTIPSLEEAETASAIIEHSQRTVIVADHTKFNNVSHGKIADIADIDAIITDSGLNPKFLESLSGLDVEINMAMV
jgi:DeoR/GlpR family transcriptional regulator of sugar metabolism